MTNLRADINEALSSANQINMKHINGLEERLSGLEKLMCDARRVEQEQKDLANAFMVIILRLTTHHKCLILYCILYL